MKMAPCEFAISAGSDVDCLTAFRINRRGHLCADCAKTVFELVAQAKDAADDGCLCWPQDLKDAVSKFHGVSA